MQTNLSNTSLFHGSKKFEKIDVNLIEMIKNDSNPILTRIRRYKYLTYI